MARRQGGYHKKARRKDDHPKKAERKDGRPKKTRQKDGYLKMARGKGKVTTNKETIKPYLINEHYKARREDAISSEQTRVRMLVECTSSPFITKGEKGKSL